jgi:DNA polymerase III subunit delta'
MSALFGHDDNMRAFKSALDAGKLHHGYILSGPRGLGKASFAKYAAQILIDPESRYNALFDSGSHPDLLMISRLPKEPPKEGEETDPSAELKRSISVDQIRGLQARLTTRPGLSDKRAIILDAADDLDRGAANALLKCLEEPPIGTYFFLISHASDRLLPTIRSRCQILRFEQLNDAEMTAALKFLVPDIDDSTLAALLRAGAGSPGQALEYLGLDLNQLEADMSAIISTGDPSNNLRTALANQLSLKSAQARYEAFLRRAPQVIAENARQRHVQSVMPAIEAWEAANTLASRAVALSLDKSSVVMQMGSLLASLLTHKQITNS